MLDGSLAVILYTIYYGGASLFGVLDSRAQPIKNGRISPSRAFVWKCLARWPVLSRILKSSLFFSPPPFFAFLTLRRLDDDVAMSHVSDSDHRRLEAVAYPDCVVESHQISDASRGLRRVHVTKVWRTERLLGRGGFGEVHLQSQESDKAEKRALKIIPTRGTKLSLADCQRELTAMIEFTKPKVGIAELYKPEVFEFSADYDTVQGRCGVCRLYRMVSKRRCHVLGNGIHAIRRP